MSDSMERDKSELMTAKEREEEEEMKRELLDMKMYETWYTYKDMKQILGFINESKDMANMANDDKNSQKELQSSNDRSSEVIMKTNLGQDLDIQEHGDTSRSHSYRANHMSPIPDRISTHSCSSPESTPTISDSRNSLYRNRNLDTDDMFDNLNARDGYAHSMNRYISLKAKNSVQEPHNIHSGETKLDGHPEREQKLERWQINPLDSCVSENDVPLRQPDRPAVEERMPFRLCKEAQTPEELEKLIHALNIHLKETADLWHSWHRTTDSKFQWGSPIQVGPPKSSSEKKLLTNVKTQQNQMECKNKFNHERPNKRKSNLIISSPDGRHSSSDEDEKTFKKKKIQFNEGSSRVLRSHKEEYATKNMNDEDLDNENISRNFNNMKTKNLEVEQKKKCKERLSPELLPSYPRKITPPSVRKTINKKKHNVNVCTKTSSGHNNNEEQSAISSVPEENNSSILTDQEILLELEKDNSNDSVNTMPENTEIKPLPMKGLSHRIKNECKLLEKIHVEKQKQMEIEKEEVKKKENEERRKREEFYRKQIEERQQREKQRAERERSKEEKSKKWNNVVDMKCRKKNVEEDRDKLRDLRERNEDRILEIMEENRLFEGDNTSASRRMEIVENDLTESVNCPICNQSFPSDRIETHAAGCEQYITDNEDETNANLFENKTSSMNINSADVLECGLCSKYKTTNGIDYEEHVNNCLQRQHQRESYDDHAGTDTNNILSSPVRCYRPISEQTDSDIDYSRQFPSNSRTRVHSNRKRKH